MSTKVVVVCSDEDTALAVEVIPGQAGEAPRLVPMLEQVPEREPVIDEVVGDKAYDGDELREQCLDRGVNPNVPLKKNRDPDKWACDEAGYKQRNKAERLFGKMKEFRRIATRYDKLKRTYLGFLHLVLGFLRLRKLSIVNTA